MPLAVVTGASHGIGRAVAVAFAREPEARLALVSRDESLLEEARALCREEGAEAELYLCDVTDEEAVKATAAAIRERWGTPDVLVNNAGLFEPGPIHDTSNAVFRSQIEVNLISAFIVTKAFLDEMITRGSGHIFFMCSVASIKAYPGGAAYCAAKHGLLGLARSLREETKKDGLRVTAVIPGATFTRSWEGAGLAEERFIPAEDVADALLNAYRLSSRSVVEEIILRPQLGDI
jgi:NAD(P)-dependent dehydrogenase (short-subunit alcohol dehydrogenase family)